MTNNPQTFLKRFPIPNRTGFNSRENKIAYQVHALWRSRDFWRRWFYATIIATQRGMARECGNKACRRKRQCVGQMQPVLYADAELACTPPCLSVYRDKHDRAALAGAVRDIEALVKQHGFAGGVKMARRMAWF